MLSLALLAVLVFVSVVTRVAAWDAARPGRAADPLPSPSPAGRVLARARTRRRTRQELPSLPAGHRPPVGLGPLSPSERFLCCEAARGLRALQVWLLDQDGSPA